MTVAIRLPAGVAATCTPRRRGRGYSIVAGRISEAKKTVERIRDFSEYYYPRGMAELAIAQWRAGWEEDAIATIDAAQERARKMTSRRVKLWDRFWGNPNLYLYHALAGDPGHGDAFLDMRMPYEVAEAIALAKATVGDVRGALRIAEKHTGNARFLIFHRVAKVIAEG